MTDSADLNKKSFYGESGVPITVYLFPQKHHQHLTAKTFTLLILCRVESSMCKTPLN